MFTRLVAVASLSCVCALAQQTYGIYKTAGSPANDMPPTSLGLGRVSYLSLASGGVMYFGNEHHIYRLGSFGVSEVATSPIVGGYVQGIWSIAASPKGDLYFATGSGLYKVAGGTQPAELLLEKYVFSSSRIFALEDGVYFNSVDGMFRWTYTGKLELVEPDSTVRLAGSDSSGNLYVWRYDGTTARLYRRSKAGAMTLLAGGGTSEPDGVPATSAKLFIPSTVVVDPQGNVVFSADFSLFIVDANTGFIRRLASAGATPFGGDGGPLANAKFGGFNQLAVDALGNIYVADSLRVRRIAAGTNIVSTFAGGGAGGDGGPAAMAQIAAPRALAVDPSSNLYIADTDNYRIRKVTAGSGMISTVVGNTTPVTWTAPPDALQSPYGLAIDSAGNLHTRYAGGGLQKWNGAALSTTMLLTFPANQAGSVAVTPNGDIYVHQHGGGLLRRKATGVTDVVGTDAIVSNGVLIAEPAGSLLFVQNDLIRRYNPGTNSSTTVAGGGADANDGALALSASISPRTLAVDSAGNIYFGEERKVKKIDAATGRIRTIAGGGAVESPFNGMRATDTYFREITALAAAADGSIYVADAVANRVWRLSSALSINNASPLPRPLFGKPYSVTFNAVGGVEPYTWTMSGVLPHNLTRTGSTISGTTSVPGVWTFTMNVTDAMGATASKEFMLAPLQEWPSESSLRSTPSNRASGDFTATIAVPSGERSASAVYIFVGTSLSDPSTACIGEYTLATKAFRLIDAAGTGWLGPKSSGLLENARCTLDVSSSSARVSSTGANQVIDVNFSLAFQPSFAGVKKTYINTVDSFGTPSGWVAAGNWNSWEVKPAEFPAPAVERVTPSVGSGAKQTFTGVFSHDSGASQLYLAYILLLPTPNVVQYTAKGSCLVEYNRISHAMRLINEAGDGWLGPQSGVPLSQGGNLSNSRCTLHVGESSAEVGSLRLVVKASVTFNASFKGMLGSFLQAVDVTDRWTGMTQFGNWVGAFPTSLDPGPYVADVSPTAITGSQATFTVIVGHTGGASQLAEVHLRISTSIVGAPACHMVYFPGSNLFNLVDASGATLVSTGVPPGSSELNNFQCKLLMNASAWKLGNNVTLAFPVFLYDLPFKGSNNVYVNAFDNAGKLTHWVKGSSIDVP